MSDLSLFVFIDAFGWELAKRHASFLAAETPNRSRLESVFGYSSTCDPTILTGLMPEDHGHFSFFYYNPAESPFGVCRLLRFLPKSITRRGRVRRVMSRVIRRLYGYTGYFQIYNMPFDVLHLFDYSEKRDLYQKGGINSGAPTIFDYLRENRVPFHLSDWQAGEETNLASLGAAIDQGQIRFAYLYMAAMDAILHDDGTSSARVEAKIAWYEAQIRALLERARKHYGKVKLYIFSDHGMTPTKETCDLIPIVQATGLKFGEDYVAVYDSTMARFWFLKPGAREKIEAALAKEPRGHVLTEAEKAQWKVRFPGNKYGEMFFLLNPGVLLCPSFMGEKALAGMHGFDPGDKDTDAMFLSSETPDPAPRRLDDLYKLMLDQAKRIVAERS